jgi:type II secretory pathway pseudopilin PulG
VKLLRDESGMTLMELIVASSLMIVVMSATLFTLERFNANAAKNTQQNEAQENARKATDRLSRDLRNLASPTPYQPQAVQKATAYDLVFQSVDPNGPNSGGNLTNTRRVRYCLDSSTPTNGVMWLQKQTWTSATAPAVPATGACPDNAWPTRERVADHIVNRAGGANRPVWTYNSTTLTEVNSIRTLLYVDFDPARRPRETALSSGVFLRNQNQPPVASFSATATGSGHVKLNGSASHDPEGQTLKYEWYLDGASQPVATGITYDLVTSPGQHTLSLKVLDHAGLSHSASPVTVNVT